MKKITPNIVIFLFLVSLLGISLIYVKDVQIKTKNNPFQVDFATTIDFEENYVTTIGLLLFFYENKLFNYDKKKYVQLIYTPKIRIYITHVPIYLMHGVFII